MELKWPASVPVGAIDVAVEVGDLQVGGLQSLEVAPGQELSKTTARGIIQNMP